LRDRLIILHWAELAYGLHRIPAVLRPHRVRQHARPLITPSHDIVGRQQRPRPRILVPDLLNLSGRPRGFAIDHAHLRGHARPNQHQRRDQHPG